MSEMRASAVRPKALFRSTVGDPGPVYPIDRWILSLFLKGIGNPAIRSVLWDGSDISHPGAGRVGMVIRNRATLLRLMANPLLNFGDDYSAGNIEIEGGVVNFLEAVYRGMMRPGRTCRRSRPVAHWLQRNVNSLSDSRRNIHHHYDIGNDFYRLWLDKEMLYTCAYYPAPDATLEEAQIAKMELVCRKLRLKEGDRVIEAGCGWGGLARYMAKHYGVKVRAFNISREQIAYARKRADAESITGVEFIEDDYRNITGECDAFVSVGMLEHVGPSHYRKLGEVINRTLSDTGLGLIHSIGQNVPESMSGWMEKRIFPGSYPPTLKEMAAIFEPYSFSILDVENLRLHYARTCEEWLERFESHRQQVEELFDDAFLRAWRLYLCGAIANFRAGNLQLFQVVFSRFDNNGIPWTRRGDDRGREPL
ncbi:cyclopropane-fatty-acyl-phospholipid synthase family protein [Geomonas sp. RF6]|uniref:SAM-dependent methyltransferase n=1 Tax=Geomonas sp. RF6 TaxID=2897342 RepID=UPI001E3EB1A6|nr:cyclopropane-fatty-acyl-phospholipid synthase family protein [Geomonas sp. RF6]UFS71069.1 cyclopropane-fatty-acyl-phospholipid synthase family protein [Geomonas sp. RF6]